VIDPSQKLDAVTDIAFSAGKVARIGPELKGNADTDIRDVSGAIVAPGLIDLHTHVYWGGTSLGIDAEDFCRRSGVTTAVDTGSAGLVYPAGGGTGWIPLAITLALLAGCLTVDALWMRSRQRRAQGARQPGRAPPPAAIATGGPARPDTARTAVMTGAVCLVVAGTAAAVLLAPVPSVAPPTAARACADYSEWRAAQNGYSWADQGALARAALTRAARVAPIGALGTDLSALAAEVSAADQFGQSPAGVGALVTVPTYIQAVDHDCFG